MSIVMTYRYVIYLLHVISLEISASIIVIIFSWVVLSFVF